MSEEEKLKRLILLKRELLTKAGYLDFIINRVAYQKISLNKLDEIDTFDNKWLPAYIEDINNCYTRYKEYEK